MLIKLQRRYGIDKLNQPRIAPCLVSFQDKSAAIEFGLGCLRRMEMTMLNGQGGVTEAWTMYGTWPETINWQELDYSANELMTCEASLKYDRAVKTA